MKTRTAVLYATGEPIRVEEIELDPPKEHEVQVKIVAAGVGAIPTSAIWEPVF